LAIGYLRAAALPPTPEKNTRLRLSSEGLRAEAPAGCHHGAKPNVAF